MIVAIFIALLTSHTWTWDASLDADGYRLYWSYDPVRWDRAYSVDVPAQFSTATMQQFPRQQYEDFPIAHLIAPSPGAAMFFVVTAYNAAGESLTEHGPTEGPPPGVGVCP